MFFLLPSITATSETKRKFYTRTLTVYVWHGDGQFDEVWMIQVFWSSITEFGRERLSAHCAQHSRLAQTCQRATQSESTQSIKSKPSHAKDSFQFNCQDQFSYQDLRELHDKRVQLKHWIIF